MTGAFITFEGIDGCGKSTQLRMIASVLRMRGYDVVSTREPGGTPLGNRLRLVLLDKNEQVDPMAELLIYAADRAQHVRTLLRPALASGHIVLSDRYADATIAYQGAGRGFKPNVISQVVELATGGLKPDLTLLFDVSVASGIARTSSRANGKQKADRLDIENAEFHTRVRNAYLTLARKEPRRIKIIDSSGSVEQTHQLVADIVLPFLDRKLKSRAKSSR